MSTSFKQLDWCLNKAKIEIDECKRLGKRPKHRGLLKINPNLEIASQHLDKAEHNLLGITKFNEIGFSDWSMSAGFYCMYHCFLAIAAKFGYESRNQTCTIALIKLLKEQNEIDLDNKYIDLLNSEEFTPTKSNIMDLREDYTYGVQISIKDEDKLNELKKNCQDLIDLTKQIIFK